MSTKGFWDEWKKERVTERASVFIGLFTVLVAFAVYIETCYQVNIAKRELATSDRTDSISLEMQRVRDSTYISSVNLEFRAWVLTKGIDKGYNTTLISRDTFIIQLRIGMINSGKTFADIDSIFSSCIIDSAKIDTTKFLTFHGFGALGSNAENIIISDVTPNISYRDFFDNDKSIFFYGRIIYHDIIFNRKRFTNFCYRVIPHYDKRTPRNERIQGGIQFNQMPYFNTKN
jgi:hypothetical protein